MERGSRMGRGGVSQMAAAWVSNWAMFSSSFFWISGQFWLIVEVVLALIRPRSTESRPLRLISAAALGRWWEGLLTPIDSGAITMPRSVPGAGAACGCAEAESGRAEVVADGGDEGGVAQGPLGELGDEAAAHAVEVGADGGEDRRDAESAAQAHGGEAVGVDHVVEDDVRGEGSDVGPQAMGGGEAVERAADQGKRGIRNVSGVDAGRIPAAIEAAGVDGRAEHPGVDGFRVEDVDVAQCGQHAQGLVGGVAVPGMGRDGEVAGDDGDFQHAGSGARAQRF